MAHRSVLTQRVFIHVRNFLAGWQETILVIKATRRYPSLINALSTIDQSELVPSGATGQLVPSFPRPPFPIQQIASLLSYVSVVAIWVFPFWVTIIIPIIPGHDSPFREPLTFKGLLFLVITHSSVTSEILFTAQEMQCVSIHLGIFLCRYFGK